MAEPSNAQLLEFLQQLKERQNTEAQKSAARQTEFNQKIEEQAKMIAALKDQAPPGAAARRTRTRTRTCRPRTRAT